MEIALYAMLLTGLFFGWIAAHIEYRRKLVRMSKQHKLELKNETYLAFVDGWDAALNDRVAVARAADKIVIR